MYRVACDGVKDRSRVWMAIDSCCGRHYDDLGSFKMNHPEDGRIAS